VKGVGKFSLNKKGSSWVKLIITGAVLLFFVYILSLLTYPAKNYFFTVSAPVQNFLWTAGASSSLYLGSFLNASSLAKENQNLKDENQKLLLRVYSLQSIDRGAQEFNQISAACQSKGFDIVMAGVVGLETNDILSINKGSVDGISEGMPVIDQQSVLFGRISKVYKNFSEVILLSNKDNVINVKVQRYQEDQSVPEGEPLPEINGVIRGLGGLSAYLDLVPINTEIKLQDILVTSAMEKYFPKDFLVGRVTKIQKDDQKPFQQAEISLFSDVSKLENLFVITNYKQAN